MTEKKILSVVAHDRDSAGLVYVYPVVSRRAGGVSIGINLNPNNACNWRCIYCQVPGLSRGTAPDIDLAQLERELRGFLNEVLHGDFMQEHVPEEARRLNDIALSGNGEPTSAACFEEVIDLLGVVLADTGLFGKIKLVLITNGSLVNRTVVRNGLRKLSGLNGEIWFKLDRGTADDMSTVNQVAMMPERALKNLQLACSFCATWVQTCMFALDGQLPDESALNAYLDLLTRARQWAVPPRGVLLYGLARASTQPEAERLSRAPAVWMQNLAERIRSLGLEVKLSE